MKREWEGRNPLPFLFVKAVYDVTITRYNKYMNNNDLPTPVQLLLTILAKAEIVHELNIDESFGETNITVLTNQDENEIVYYWSSTNNPDTILLQVQ